MKGLSDDLLETLKKAAAVLKRHEIPFALAGGFAVYARGGFSSDHDVDFIIKEQDVDKTLEVLVDAGFRAERPPEDWLVKVYDGQLLVDLIFRPVERLVTDETLTDVDMIKVGAVNMPVLSATELMVHKLLTFNQHHCDFARALPLARSLREQINWERVRAESKESPYAYAFLILLDLLELLPGRNGFGHGEPPASESEVSEPEVSEPEVIGVGSGG